MDVPRNWEKLLAENIIFRSGKLHGCVLKTLLQSFSCRIFYSSKLKISISFMFVVIRKANDCIEVSKQVPFSEFKTTNAYALGARPETISLSIQSQVLRI